MTEAQIQRAYAELQDGLRDAVEEQMEMAGVTRAELSRRLGVSPAYVSNVLNGVRTLTLRGLIKIATALDLGFDIVLEPDE